MPNFQSYAIRVFRHHRPILAQKLIFLYNTGLTIFPDSLLTETRDGTRTGEYSSWNQV